MPRRPERRVAGFSNSGNRDRQQHNAPPAGIVHRYFGDGGLLSSRTTEMPRGGHAKFKLEPAFFQKPVTVARVVTRVTSNKGDLRCLTRTSRIRIPARSPVSNNRAVARSRVSNSRIRAARVSKANRVSTVSRTAIASSALDEARAGKPRAQRGVFLLQRSFPANALARRVGEQ